MVQGGMGVVKYLMFIFNFVFVACGLALIIIGAIAQSSGNHYTALLDGKFVTAPILLIILGVVIFFIAFLGCWGAMKENHCMVTTFGVLMFIIFIVEIAAGITAYVYRNDLENTLNKSMNKTFRDRDLPINKDIWEDMQKELKCCGVNGPLDYNSTKVFKQCCEDQSGDCTVVTAYQDGCFKKLEEYLRGKITIVGGVGLGIAAIELLGIIFAFCLARAIKKEYEGV